MTTAMPEGASGDLSRDIRPIATSVGAVFSVHLWEDRTRGELWVPSYDPAALALVSDEFLRIASNNAVDTGRRTFEFRAVSAGEHRLLFEKRMGWKFTAEDRRLFLVRVDAGAADGEGA